MKKTIKVIPRIDERMLPDYQEFYTIELDIYLESTELVDVSYVVEALTKSMAHIEYMLKSMSESRKDVDNNDKS